MRLREGASCLGGREGSSFHDGMSNILDVSCLSLCYYDPVPSRGKVALGSDLYYAF